MGEFLWCDTWSLRYRKPTGNRDRLTRFRVYARGANAEVCYGKPYAAVFVFV